MTERWSCRDVAEWYAALAPVRGCNYLPRTAVNSTEMWQAESHDSATMAEELGWARDCGFNSVRVFLPYLVWRHDPEGQKARMDRFMGICEPLGLRTMWILFDDCAFAGKEPFLGPQDDPVPGVHNSGWTPSPGHALVDDHAAWPQLERYVKDVVGTFARDGRVLVWDIYNEPGMSGVGQRSAALVEAAVGWARETGPDQPITVGAYSHEFGSAASRRLMELSDVVSFHGYDCPGRLAEKLAVCGEYGRPILCTECIVRRDGNDFERVLPLFAEHGVGWYMWGLVAGRTQTYMPWGSEAGAPMPDVWQHDAFWPDGTPYDHSEMELVREFRFG